MTNLHETDTKSYLEDTVYVPR